MAYADDVVITGRTRAALAGAVEEFARAAQELGLQINIEKTKYIETSSRDRVRAESVLLGEYTFPCCSAFKYLGGVVTESNQLEDDIKSRMVAGTRCFYALQKALRFKSLSRKAKLAIYRTVIRPIVMYGSETWTLTKENGRALLVWERRVLRKIFGAVKERDRWRIRSNAELMELYGEPDIVCAIKKGRLRWLGHIERMEPCRLPKKMLNGTPGGKRKRGRPRQRWLDDLEADLRRLGVRNWRRLAADREEWCRVVAEAQVLQGL